MKKTSSLLLLVPFLLVSCAQKQVSKETFLDAVSKIEQHQYREAQISCAGNDKEKQSFQYHYSESLSIWTSQDDSFGAYSFLLVPLSADYVEALTGGSKESSDNVTFYINPLAIECNNLGSYTKMTYNKYGYVEKYFIQRTDSSQGEATSLDIIISYK